MLSRDRKNRRTPNLLRWFNEASTAMASTITSCLSEVRFIENPFFIVAFIQIPGMDDEIAFLGAMNNWISLGKLVLES